MTGYLNLAVCLGCGVVREGNIYTCAVCNSHAINRYQVELQYAEETE